MQLSFFSGRHFIGGVVAALTLSCSNLSSRSTVDSRSPDSNSNRFSGEGVGENSPKRPSGDDQDPPGYTRGAVPKSTNLVATLDNLAPPKCRFRLNLLTCNMQVTEEGKIQPAASVQTGTTVKWTVGALEIPSNTLTTNIALSHEMAGTLGNVNVGVALQDTVRNISASQTTSVNMTINDAILFLSSTKYDGDLKTAGSATTGLDGADALCTRLAIGGSPNIPRTYQWRAFLGTVERSIIYRFGQIGQTRSVGGVELVPPGGGLVLNGNLQSEFFTNELGQPFPGTEVSGTQQTMLFSAWIGVVDADRVQLNDACKGFQSNSQFDMGNAGLLQWNSPYPRICDIKNHLICVGFPSGGE